jgi:hypothetical protein
MGPARPDTPGIQSMPSPPTGLTASSFNQYTVQVSWTNAVDATLLFTRVYVSTTNTFAYTNFNIGVLSASGANQSTNVGGLTPGTTYYFWLQAESNTSTPTLSTTVGSVSAVPAAVYSVTAVYDFIALDVLKLLVANITGFGVGTGTFPLYTGPPVAGTADAGYVSLAMDVPFNPHNRTNGCNLTVMCLSTTESHAYGAAQAIRLFLHPKGDLTDFSLPSGRFVLAARNAVKQEQTTLDANGRYQVQVSFLLQLQDDFN